MRLETTFSPDFITDFCFKGAGKNAFGVAAGLYWIYRNNINLSTQHSSVVYIKRNHNMMSICVNVIYDSVQYTYFNKYQIICLDVPSEYEKTFFLLPKYEEARAREIRRVWKWKWMWVMMEGWMDAYIWWLLN